MVTPADPPVVVDGLITGWHDAGASHLLLVEAVAGTALGQAAYDAALAEGYRWHEFGDSALFLPRRRGHVTRGYRAVTPSTTCTAAITPRYMRPAATLRRTAGARR